jgi:hypothetical protein
MEGATAPLRPKTAELRERLAGLICYDTENVIRL